MTGLDILRRAASGEGKPPCSELVGWEAIDLEAGRVRVRFQARESFCNPTGNIQGGFLAAMLDDAMGPALFTLLDDTSFSVTLEMKVSFLRPAKPGALIGEGRVVQRTRGVGFLEGTLTEEDGALIAAASATARIVAANGGARGAGR